LNSEIVTTLEFENFYMVLNDYILRKVNLSENSIKDRKKKIMKNNYWKKKDC
jgi:hypothetical protein